MHSVPETETQIAALDDLTPHPKNYLTHPEDQVAHIVASIQANGFYRNVVVANDYTILAGHGSVIAARRCGLDSVPVVVLPYDPDSPEAMKVLTGDNEINNLAGIDDRALTEILKDIHDQDQLLGTGFDDKILANLVMVTRDANEVADFDAAAEWVGLPDYEKADPKIVLQLVFETLEERNQWIAEQGYSCRGMDKTRTTALHPPGRVGEHKAVTGQQWQEADA